MAKRDYLVGGQIDPERGFLPSSDPIQRVPGEFAVWEETARDLPKLLAAGGARSVLDRLPVVHPDADFDDGQNRRAMLLLSYFGHAYVWGGPDAIGRVPPGVAIPWYEVSQRLGRPPVLSYASYALDNWRRLDPSDPIELGNIVLLQNFLGGMDEEWFILVHVAIEAKAGRALAAMVAAQDDVARDRPGEVTRRLGIMSESLQAMYEILLRMPERCDPHIYYRRVRPYIHGWKDHPALPEGVLYEGVDAYGGRPQKFRGETGAQSSIVPSLDAALGISHKDDPLRPYLIEMRDYMPPEHRRFIQAMETGPAIRQYVLAHKDNGPLREAYNQCVDLLQLFRSTHLEYARTYIQKQSQRSQQNPVEVGTGGTPFIAYLKKHRDETGGHKIA
ncbi:MAG: indoleamine 2,3-dioxygenase [Deltaproteobacteria bacterium]|nr:indoleamine 2,3-dioxygenase [Deltaproteobacteria bacterium]